MPERSSADSTFVLLDGDASWAGQARVVARWSTLDAARGEVSIPAEVEKRALEIRRDYIQWISALGNYPVHGTTLKAYLRVHGGLSSWWTSLIAEKESL